MQTVVMVSYCYPPMGSPGALRTVKFAKYLGAFGWAPVVVTPDSGFCVTNGLGQDQNLPGVTVIRTGDLGGLKRSAASAVASTSNNKSIRAGLLRIARELAIPDRDIPWFPFAYRVGASVIRSQPVHALYSTSPSITNHLVARLLSRRFALPWIADFRDLWTLSSFYRAPRWRARVERQIERAIVIQADRIVVVSEFIREMFAGEYPDYADKFVVIRNAFDPDDFREIEPSPPRDKVVLAYAGMFYGGGRDPEPLFEAIRRLYRARRLGAHNFRLELIGRPETPVQEAVVRAGISDLVEFTGPLPYSQTLQRLAKASALVVLTHTDPLSRGEMTTKFFDYLGVGLPILLLAPSEFELAQLTRDTGVGDVVNPTSTDAIAAWISDRIDGLGANGYSHHLRNLASIREFTREVATGRLASLLESASRRNTDEAAHRVSVTTAAS